MARLALERFHKIHVSSPLQHAGVDGAGLVAVTLDVAEPASYFTLRDVARESFALHQFFDALLEMKTELVVELFVDPTLRSGKPKGATHVSVPAPAPRSRGR